jgi:hypothetical protein
MYQTHSFLKLNATAVILVTLKQIVLVLYNLLKKIWLLWSRWLITSAVTHDDDRVRGWHLRTGSSWLLCALLGRRWLLFCRFFFKKMFTFYIMECRFLKLLFSWSRWNGIDCSPSSWQFVMVPHGQNVIVYLDFTSFIFFLKISHPLC